MSTPFFNFFELFSDLFLLPIIYYLSKLRRWIFFSPIHRSAALMFVLERKKRHSLRRLGALTKSTLVDGELRFPATATPVTAIVGQARRWLRLAICQWPALIPLRGIFERHFLKISRFSGRKCRERSIFLRFTSQNAANLTRMSSSLIEHGEASGLSKPHRGLSMIFSAAGAEGVSHV